MKEYVFNSKKLANVQSTLVYSSFLYCYLEYLTQPIASYLTQYRVVLQEKMVGKIYHLNTMAKEAYRSYILAYNAHSMKEIFNVHRLDLQVQLPHHILHYGYFHIS